MTSPQKFEMRYPMIKPRCAVHFIKQLALSLIVHRHVVEQIYEASTIARLLT